MTYDCDFCDRTFDTVRGLRSHCCRVHKEDMDEARKRAEFERSEEFIEARARELSREFTGNEDAWPAFVNARL